MRIKLKTRKGLNEANPLALPRELTRILSAVLRHGAFGLSLQAMRSVATKPALDGPLSESRFFDLVGEGVMKLFDALGPIYGKAGQVVLSRLSPPLHAMAETIGFTRLYKDWPQIPFAEVEKILDQEVPRWRLLMDVEPFPLGVASLAQVHAAKLKTGEPVVVKIIKPRARERLIETAEALDQIILSAEPLAVTLVARRLVRELKELNLGFRRELSLGRERETILRVAERLSSRRQKLLVIPKVYDELCAEGVLVVERFFGTPLSDVVSGKAELTAGERQKLARGMLSELLVQVFELGLFHADPHAGNLIMMDDGSIGLFDWGLSGELLESDRRHIASILKAVIALDFEQLIDALVTMGEEQEQSLDREKVRKELSAVISLIKRGKAEPDKKPSLHQLFEACLRGAARLGLEVPEGLLMMAKSLITVEGLAKGIDPKVSLARAATPILLKAARPTFKDFVAIGARLPALARQMFRR